MNNEAIEKFVQGGNALGMNLISFGSGVLAFTLGLWMLVSAVMRIYKRSAYPNGQFQPEYSWTAISMRAAFAAVLMRFAASVDDMQHLLFDKGIQDYRTTMSYTPLERVSSGVYQQVMELVLLWVFVIAMFGFLRGILLWIKAGDGHGSGQGGDLMWRGFWHILGGTLGMNLPALIQAFNGS